MSMLNKVCLITGASSGIGKETALALAAQGAELFLLCRNAQKGEAVLAEIAAQFPECRATLLLGDLASQQDIRRVAQNFLDTGKPLHLLLNNAGVMNTKRKVTAEGIEETFAVNHLAYFLLTNLLLERIKESVPNISFNGLSGDLDKSTYTLVNIGLPISQERAVILLFHLDIKGIACSKGSACQSGSDAGSHVLNEVLSEEDIKKPSLRFSFSNDFFNW